MRLINLSNFTGQRCSMLFFLKIFLSLAFFAWLIHKMTGHFVNLRWRWMLVIAFIVRCISGMVYGQVFLKYFGGDDTWYFNRGALDENVKLVHHPLMFLKDLDPIQAFSRSGTFVHNFYVYLNDLEFWLITKPLAVYHLFSQGDYALNAIFFNFISIWGSIWLYQLFANKSPKHSNLIFGLIFFFPPFVFWLSGIRGDALVFMFVALSFSQLQNCLDKGFSLKKSSLLVVGFWGVIVFRSPVMLVLLPAMTAWVLQVKNHLPVWKSLGIVYGIGLLIFFWIWSFG